MNRSYGIFVVELNDGKAYLGRVKVTKSSVIVYSGYTGRPPVIPIEEVDRMVPAHSHPDVTS